MSTQKPICMVCGSGTNAVTGRCIKCGAILCAGCLSTALEKNNGKCVTCAGRPQ